MYGPYFLSIYSSTQYHLCNHIADPAGVHPELLSEVDL